MHRKVSVEITKNHIQIFIHAYEYGICTRNLYSMFKYNKNSLVSLDAKINLFISFSK